jgi:hypothetical protein
MKINNKEVVMGNGRSIDDFLAVLFGIQTVEEATKNIKSLFEKGLLEFLEGDKDITLVINQTTLDRMYRESLVK